MDHGDHNPPWWTRSIQDHLGPPSDIFLMLPLLSPYRSRPISRLQLQSTHMAGTLLPLRLTLRFLHGGAPRLRSFVVLHCLGGGYQRLGFMSHACNGATVLSGPCAPLVLPSLSVTLGFIVVITHIYFIVDVYGKGFPVDSAPCIYWIFLFRPFSQSLISYFTWLVCGWSHSRATWVDGFFPGAGVDIVWEWGFFFAIASAPRGLCS